MGIVRAADDKLAGIAVEILRDGRDQGEVTRTQSDEHGLFSANLDPEAYRVNLVQADPRWHPRPRRSPPQR